MVQRADLRENLSVCAWFATTAFLSTIALQLAVNEPSSTTHWANLFLGATLSALIAIRAYFDKTRSYTAADDQMNGICRPGFYYPYGYGLIAFAVPLFTFGAHNAMNPFRFHFSRFIFGFSLSPFLAAFIAIRAYNTNPQERGAAQTETDDVEGATALVPAPTDLQYFYGAREDFRAFRFFYFIFATGIHGDSELSFFLLIASIMWHLNSMYGFY